MQQQVVELSGYVIILVENAEGKIKLYGSPSDRDNLEVGDEILEVNGLTLDNISRTEAIRHIHDVSGNPNLNYSLSILQFDILPLAVHQILHDLFACAQEE